MLILKIGERGQDLGGSVLAHFIQVERVGVGVGVGTDTF